MPLWDVFLSVLCAGRFPGLAAPSSVCVLLGAYSPNALLLAEAAWDQFPRFV